MSFKFKIRKALLTSWLSAIIISSLSFSTQASPFPRSEQFKTELSNLEKFSQGKLGVYLIDPSAKQSFSYNGDERFPFCSTSKILVTAKLLQDSQSLPNLLDSKVDIKQTDLVNYNPITGRKVGMSMTVSELSMAALQYSDNTAMNLLLQKAGGIDAINKFARTLGDKDFLLSRNEPSLNTSIPGDIRDTTTPKSMANTVEKLTLGNGLINEKKNTLVTWMKGNTTGGASIKAGIPSTWVIADKTGTGDYGTTNDVAIMWTDKNKPLILVTYFTQFEKDAKPRKDVLSKAAKIVTSYIQ